MNISKFCRIICSICLILILLISSVGYVYAETASELKSQQSNIDQKINEIKSEIKENKENQSTALNQIKQLNSEISVYEDEISGLEDRMDIVNAQIVEKEANLVEQQQKYDEQKEKLETRLIALYENGTTSFLDMLLSADGLTDFISRYYMISQIAEFDDALLEGIENTQKQIQAEKDYLESAKKEIDETKTAIEGKKTSLASSRNKKQDIVNTLSAEEAELNNELEEHEKYKREIQAKIASMSAKYTGTPVAPSAAGYISPLPGKTKANITTGYRIPSYQSHTGVDFACAAGTPIYAVKDGTVVVSMAKKNSSGKYISYGEYIIIDHEDGTMTLYAHMTAGSRTVNPGDRVSQGQTIGLVGSTGNSTGNHLHFEVHSGGKNVNPVPYLP